MRFFRAWPLLSCLEIDKTTLYYKPGRGQGDTMKNIRMKRLLLKVLLVSGSGLALLQACEEEPDAPATGISHPSLDGLNFPSQGNQTTDVTLERVFSGLRFSAPLFLTSAGDGSGRIYVMERGGRIISFENDPAVRTSRVLIDLSDKVRTSGELGLLGMAFSPDYESDGLFYVHYNTREGRTNYTIISRFQTRNGVAQRSSEEQLIRLEQPYSNHNGGMIAFGQDGHLYIGLGDGGLAGDPRNRSQDNSNLFGAILRIDVSGGPGSGYTIPPDNPLVGGSRTDQKEIYAWGLRNPWRFSFDRKTGELWAGDVGQDAWEEIDIIENGGNYGWKIREGKHSYSSGSSRNLIDPVFEYPHSKGRSVTGGYVYRGAALPAMRGTYIYADYETGFVGGITRDGQGNYTSRDLTSGSNIASFGEDADGEIYALSLRSGYIYKVVGRLQNPGSRVFPQRLSETGIFTDLRNLTVNPSLVSYDVNTELWSDGAIKSRWVAFPTNENVGFKPQGGWDFPQGSVLVKHFDLPTDDGNPAVRRRLETRVLLYEAGGWKGYTYKWRADNSDADLLGQEAVSETYTIRTATGGSRSQTWTYPGQGDCMSCHTDASGIVLGPRTGQLNGPSSEGDRRNDNQLTEWNEAGMFTANIGNSTDDFLRFTALDDDNASLNDRARSYLATNCANCHMPGGVDRIGMDLSWGSNLRTVLNQQPESDELVIPGSLLIKPGDKAGSMLWIRMQRTDSNRMPSLGSHVVDQEAVDLIGRWIDAGAR